MSDPTREEFDAKLATVEANLNVSLVKIDAKMDRLLDRVEIAVGESKEAKDAANQAKSAASNIKWNIFFSVLGVIGIMYAAWAIWAQGVEMVGTLLGALPTDVK